MSAVPGDGLSLAALVFLLGLRHGFDPDHLVAIDGLTRGARRQELRRWNGLFFSLGHGAVVTLVGLVVALAATEWAVPPSLREVGAYVSIAVLLVLGAANLAAVFRTPADRRVSLVGLRGRWLAERLSGASHPVFIASIGAAFALSFDTISHALMFSLTGATLAGWLFATLLGLVFTLGMVLTDALSGWWVAQLVDSADRRAPSASRIMCVAIALLCLSIAGSAAMALELSKPLVSLGTIVVLAAAWRIACRASPRDGESSYGTGKSEQAG